MSEDIKLCTVKHPDGITLCAEPLGHGPVEAPDGALWAHSNGERFWGAESGPFAKFLGGICAQAYVDQTGLKHVCTHILGHRDSHHDLGTGTTWGATSSTGQTAEEALSTWNVGAAAGPQPMPHATACGHMDGAGGGFWACFKPTGHEGPHDYHRLDSPPSPAPGQTAKEALDALRQAVPGAKILRADEFLKLITESCDGCDACKPSAGVSARIRLVPLPDAMDGARQGFALVVDRLGDAATADAQRHIWDEFGDEIGASVTFVYPGDLTIDASVSAV